MREHFLLDPEVVFLNHGSFGACPRPVFEAYQQWQRELECQPVEFLGRRAGQLLEEVRTVLGAYLNAAPQDLALVTNATVGINIVARSLPLQPGDEILISDQEYGAVRMTWEYYAARSGAVVIQQPINLPTTTPEAVIDSLWQAVTPRTRVIAISHVTSPTAIILPITDICARARAAGIWTVIDGAHAPGQIDVDLQTVGADFYTGNCHKWMCAPKGAAFVYVRREHQAMIDPLVISWGSEVENPFEKRHEWMGTRDIAAQLAIPAAIAFQQAHDWSAVQARCHALLCQARRRIQDLTGLRPLTPESRQWFSQMAAIPLPGDVALYSSLDPDYKIEVPVSERNGRVLMRVSVQAYNTARDVDRLLEALHAIIRRRG